MRGATAAVQCRTSPHTSRPALIDPYDRGWSKIQRQEVDEMASFDSRPETAFPSAVSIQERLGAFLSAVYGWMCGGLAITATTAWLVAGSPTLVRAIALNRLLFWG